MPTVRPATLLVAAMLALAAPAFGADPVLGLIRERLEQLRTFGALRVDGTSIDSARLLPRLYERHGFRPLWNEEARRQLLAGLREAPAHGLDPSDYHLEPLERLLSVHAGPAATEHRADLDMLLTDSLIRYAYHLFLGKVDPRSLEASWNLRRRIQDADPVALLAGAIESGSVADLLSRAAPSHPYYARLQAGLAEYRALQERGGWTSVPAGPSLRPGARDPRVAAVRERLAVTAEVQGPSADPELFDDGLVEAVRRFQTRQGLNADGIVGRLTLEALNVPVQARIDQLRVNLERARWLLHAIKGEYVIIDIAGYRAAYIRDGKTVWESRAQVGQPYRETPVFRSALSYLVINPTWTVPPTVLGKDVLPAMSRDSGYLAKRKLRVLDQDGAEVDPATIEWSRHTARSFPYLLRQDPGPDNALGRIKFMFPNEHQVYLHDTPNRALFERDQRTFSSGCIRIEKPLELAELLLEDGQGWSRERILAAIESKHTQTVYLPRRVPILLLYWTVAVGEDGTVGFRRDIYGRDRAVLQALEGEPPSARPTLPMAGARPGPAHQPS
jgi:murein L,D-transpeptidase YcbB/YkuD